MNPVGRMGILTPSSNTALEPITCAIMREIPEISVHFSRFTVTQIALDNNSTNQFDDNKMLDAAALLADARVSVIGWSGTAASWLGFDVDERLCRKIYERTGVRATTSVLAMNEAFRAKGAKRVGLISPYVDDVQRKIIENYRDIGIEIIAEEHLNLSVNYEFGEVEESTLMDMARRIATKSPDAMCIMCTNLRGAGLAGIIESELGIPLYDSISTVTWSGLRMLGIDTERVRGWGSLFGG